MKRQKITGLVMSLILAASSYGRPQEAGMPGTMNERTITVRIHNYAQVRPSMLVPATKVATDILREAGVESVWVDCIDAQTLLSGAACASPVTPLDLVLNLIPRSQAKHFHFRDEIFGVAMETNGEDFGVFASVFYDTVKDCAAQRQMDLAQLLGHIIAHELAHLLSGANSHSSQGLMRALWRSKEVLAAGQHGLCFSPSEKRQLQVTLTARAVAALNRGESPQLVPTAMSKNGLSGSTVK